MQENKCNSKENKGHKSSNKQKQQQEHEHWDEEKQKQLNIIKSKAEKIDKPIIYSEGYNYKYLLRAKEIFLPEIDLDIKDCGGKNELQKLFKLFGKLKSTNQMNTNGIGLGLCICKSIC